MLRTSKSGCFSSSLPNVSLNFLSEGSCEEGFPVIVLPLVALTGQHGVLAGVVVGVNPDCVDGASGPLLAR